MKKLYTLVSAGLVSTFLAACAGASSDVVPTSSAPTAGAVRSSRPPTPNAIKQVQIPKNSCCSIAIDPTLNRIYVSSGVNLRGNHTTVFDGSSFSVVAHVDGFGGANNVDAKTHNVWLPGLYRGDVKVYSGSTDSSVTNVSLSDCPVSSWVDAKRRYAWVAAQCGSGNDPAWAVDADSYAVVAGPIDTDGVMGLNVLNPVTGKFYVNKNSGGNFEINPVTFKASATSFGVALGVDSTTDLLYASVANGLNIVDGRTEKVGKTVSLSYSPGFMGVNPHLNHIYLGAGGQNSIQVCDGTTGTPLGTITFASGVGIWSLGADEKRARIYAVGTLGGNDYLYVIKDRY